ncbi:9595_t:CDS:2 [Entrophospora sp. SA101]|nr:9595_t:CDS:2 [Entrophospora sp. SA101]
MVSIKKIVCDCVKVANNNYAYSRYNSYSQNDILLNDKPLKDWKLAVHQYQVSIQKLITQRVELTDYWPKQYPESTTGIKFLVMYLGRVDTPGVSTSMENFYNNFKNQLKSIDQGIDTTLWAAFSKEVSDISSESFLFNRQVVSSHLPLAQTKSIQQEVEALVEQIDNYVDVALNF